MSKRTFHHDSESHNKRRKITFPTVPTEEQLLDASKNGDTEFLQLMNDNIAGYEILAMRWASWNGHNETVQFLIDNKADVNADINYAIQGASDNGHTETVKLLIDNKADVTDCAIRCASRNGHTKIVKLLIDNAKADITGYEKWAIRWASGNGHNETVQLLIDNKADVTCLDNFAIQCASAGGHTKTVRLLSRYGADISILSEKEQENLEEYNKRLYEEIDTSLKQFPDVLIRLIDQYI